MKQFFQKKHGKYTLFFKMSVIIRVEK